VRGRRISLMRPGFVVMQIGNPTLDAIYRDVIVPACADAGVEAKRVDRHNEGRLLNSEIARLIGEAEIIVADLTNERPNCYLEVGYAMGRGKFEHLILTAREDHKPDRPGRQRADPKVHFDLGGYDLLYWNPDALDDFRARLTRTIRYRLQLIPPPALPVPLWDEPWIAAHRGEAYTERLKQDIDQATMEFSFQLPHVSATPKRLLEVAGRSVVQGGWPLALIMEDNRRPRPLPDGIVAKIPTDESYDYWALSTTGLGYVLSTNFEERRFERALAIDMRIRRALEMLLYVRNLAVALGVSEVESIPLAVHHAGLSGRHLRYLTQNIITTGTWLSVSDATGSSITTSIGAINADPVTLVQSIIAPVLALFDFFDLPDATYRLIVDAALQGRSV